MQIFVAAEGSEVGNFRAVVDAFPDAWEGRVLDVGCRSGNLSRALSDHSVSYCGLDLQPPADVIGNLDVGLPFYDRSFDTVVALDILEHTDHIHEAFGELCRVSRTHVVITLPNLYDVTTRMKFLRGSPLSGKYGLPTEPPADRHRWLFSYSDAERFCARWAERSGFHISAQGSLIGPRRAFALGKTMVRRFPNLFSPRYLVLLTRTHSSPLR